jgi:hypothetical protein
MPIANPGAPTNLLVTPGNSQLTVSFTAPLDNGGVPISDYEYKLNGGSWVSAGTTSPFTITGLTNGTSYAVAMRTKTIDSVPTTRYSVDSSAASGIPATVPAQVSSTAARLSVTVLSTSQSLRFRATAVRQSPPISTRPRAMAPPGATGATRPGPRV